MTETGLILIVEDEPLIRMLAVEMVEDAGFRAIEAGTAAEALAILRECSGIGCVFTDVNMPGAIDGLDLAAIIKRDWPDVHIIVTSGQPQDLGGQLQVAERFVPKPYNSQELTRALEVCA